MKILVTGCTTLMSNQRRQKTSTFLSFFPLLVQLLKDLGHQVDWRAVVPNEPGLADRYDIAFLGLQAVNGLAGKQYKWGTLWAASQLPHAVVFDDWQVRTSCRSLRYRGGENLISKDDPASLETDMFWKTAMLGKRENEWRDIALANNFETIERVRNRWFESIPIAVAPLFEWGLNGKFQESHPMDSLIRLDPTALVMPLTFTAPQKKRRAFYYAGLKDHHTTLRRMGFNVDQDLSDWPVLHNMPVSGTRNWGRITEQEVVQKYAENWGVVSVPYSKAMLGNGWWRSRFNYCAHVRSVLVCDPREIGRLDPSIYGLDIEDIRSLNNSQLTALAAAQHEELVGTWAPTKDQLLSITQAGVNHIAANGEAIR